MCGISGIAGIDSPDAIEKMVSIQSHRGPDDSGIEKLSKSPPFFLGHNRLSIIDLSERGHQPMFNEDKNLCIVYNGEVYNFMELREELKQCGYSFMSGTDTEVILKAYDLWGTDCLGKFNGMFAFALYDRKRNKVILARDRLGIKPLYYWQHNNKFAFASEIKALLPVNDIKNSVELDIDSLVSYVSLLWCPSTGTPFKSIKRLAPGTYLEYDLKTGQCVEKEFWNISFNKKTRTDKEAQNEVFELLSKSVKRRMIADVKVGAFLSGGLDSSAIAKLMSMKTSEKIEAFTISFSQDDQRVEAMMDDYKYAEMLSKQSNFNLHEIEISARETIDLLPKIVYHLDEPIGDPAAVNTYLISKLAKDSGVTILLSGQGSDEIFGGYRKFLACQVLEKYQKYLPSTLRSAINSLIKRLPVVINGKGIRHTRWLKRFLLDKPDELFGVYYSLCRFIELDRLSQILHKDVLSHISDRVHREVFNEAGGSYLDQMCYTETKLFLPGLNLNYCDKTTMAASIECRVPFVDHELVEYAFTLQDNMKVRNFNQKYILKKAMEEILPHEIIYRPKMPFSSPLRSWVKNDMKVLVDEYLSENRIRKQGLFNYKGIANLIEEDVRGMRDNAHVIYGLLSMQIWLDTFNLS